MPKFAQLAAAGFRYKVEDDFVQCAFCYLTEYNYLSTLDPFILHAKKNPYYMYLRKKKGDLWIDNVRRNYQRDYEDKLFICCVCNIRKIANVLQPCGHAIFCDLCLMRTRECAHCKTEFCSYRKIYY